MKLKTLLLVSLLTLSSLTACKTTADIDNDRYSVDLGDDRRDGGYKKCPPGHHMKGWC